MGHALLVEYFTIPEILKHIWNNSNIPKNIHLSWFVLTPHAVSDLAFLLFAQHPKDLGFLLTS